MDHTTLILVRHGQTVANRDNIISGHFDTPLTELGRQQAAEAADALRDFRFDAVYTSDLQRAVETAEIIAGQPVPPENRYELLRERSFGSLEGGPNEEWKRLKDEAHEKLDEHERWHRRFRADVESDKELHERIMGALADIGKRHPRQAVLIVIHGGLIRATLLGLDYVKSHQLKSGAFRNGGHIRLKFDGQIFSVEHVDGLTTHEGAE